MSRFCFMSGFETTKVYLLLALVSIGGAAIQPSLVSASGLTPLQASGTTWELLHSDYTEAVFVDVVFLNTTHGWVVGRESENVPSNILILHTSDGGDSWQLQNRHWQGMVDTVDVIDEQTAWVDANGRVLYTLDGGKTWNESVVAGAIGGLSTVKFVNHTHGWTANNNVLYRTTDGGQSWQSVPGWTFDDDPKDMVVLPPLDIWASGYSGIYHSTNGGETWKQVSRMGGSSMSFVSGTEAWVVSDNRLAHMTDGENWTELVVPGAFPWLSLRLMAPYLSDVQFMDKDHGWIVGTEIPVMYTPDGGANWYRQSVPSIVADTRTRIMAIDCIDQTHGWAVGTGGVIMRTTSADSLGARLWGGSADVLVLSVIGAVVVVVAGGFFALWRRRRRPVASTSGANPTLPEIT